MNLRRTGAIARKEMLHVLRDPRSLIMAVAIPMMLMILYGYALSVDVNEVPLVVYDQNNTPSSRALISHFTGSPYFSLRGHVDNYADTVRAIDAGKAMIALVIPADFDRQVLSRRPAPVQALIDGSDANRAMVTKGYARMAASAYSQGILLDAMRRTGETRMEKPVELRPRVWFNEDMESRNFIVPGLIAVIMSIIAALLTSLTVAQEWELGTMEQLIATPVKRHELVTGKLAPYFAIGMCDLMLCVVMGRFLFNVPFRGSLLLLFAAAAVFLAGVLAVGLLISIATRNMLLAVQTAMMVSYLPALMLSGFFVAIANMPRPIQLVTCIVPARYFVTLLKSIYLKGLGLEVLWGDAALLTVFGVIMVCLATKKLHKKLA